MPESKSRHPHKHQQPVHHNVKSKQPSRAVLIAILFLALLGLGIGYFIGGNDSVSLGVGAIAGAVAGYLFGRQIDKTIARKK